MKIKLLKRLTKPIRVKIQKSATTVVYDPVTEDILKKEQANLEIINRRARIDGAKGLPKYDQKHTSSAELEIKSKFEHFLRDSVRRIGLVITNLREQLDSVKRIHDMFDIDPKRALKVVMKEGYDQLDQELEVINEEVDNKVAMLARERDRLAEERNRDITEKKNTEDKMKNRPRKKPFWAFLRYAIILFFGAVADVAVTFKNLEKVAKTSGYGSLALVAIVALALALSAHYFGKSAKTVNGKGLVFSLLCTLMFLGFITYVAFESPEGNWMIVCINVGMFIFLSLVSYTFTEKDEELITKFFADEKAIRNAEKKLKKIDDEIISLRSQANQQKLKLTKEHEAQINRKVEEHQARTVEDYNAISQRLKEFEAYLANVKERFTALYRKQVFSYRNLNQDERKDRDIPLVEMWEDNYVEPLLLSSDDTNSTPDQPIFKPGSNGLTILLIVSILSLGSCDLVEPPTGMDTEAIILPDETDELAFDPEATATWLLFDLIGLDTSTSFKPGISIYVSSLNDRYTNRTWTASLPKSGSGFTEITEERIAMQCTFHKEATEVLRQGYNFTGERPRSKLYRPICEAMHRLRQSSAERKICIIFSDTFENTKYLSFYDYQYNPGKLQEGRNFIIEKLEAQCTLPDLTGIELYIIHQPTLEMDELFDAAKQFWRSYFEEKGATVYFLAGI